MKSITVKITDEQWVKIKTQAQAAGVSVSDVVRTALDGGGNQSHTDDLERRLGRLEEMAGL